MSATIPVGLLAGTVLGSIPEPKAPETAEIPRFICSSLDPNYIEPPSLDEFMQTVDDLTGDTVHVFLKLLINRIAQLEAAIAPIANVTLMFANMKLCLAAKGRHREPCGGIWVNGFDGGNIIPNEEIFFNLIDAFGRKRAEMYLFHKFQETQDAKLALQEKENLKADAHLEGPLGGPVTGKVQ